MGAPTPGPLRAGGQRHRAGRAERLRQVHAAQGLDRLRATDRGPPDRRWHRPLARPRVGDPADRLCPTGSVALPRADRRRARRPGRDAAPGLRSVIALRRLDDLAIPHTSRADELSGDSRRRSGWRSRWGRGRRSCCSTNHSRASIRSRGASSSMSWSMRCARTARRRCCRPTSSPTSSRPVTGSSSSAVGGCSWTSRSPARSRSTASSTRPGPSSHPAQGPSSGSSRAHPANGSVSSAAPVTTAERRRSKRSCSATWRPLVPPGLPVADGRHDPPGGPPHAPAPPIRAVRFRDGARRPPHRRFRRLRLCGRTSSRARVHGTRRQRAPGLRAGSARLERCARADRWPHLLADAGRRLCHRGLPRGADRRPRARAWHHPARVVAHPVSLALVRRPRAAGPRDHRGPDLRRRSGRRPLLRRERPGRGSRRRRSPCTGLVAASSQAGRRSSSRSVSSSERWSDGRCRR